MVRESVYADAVFEEGDAHPRESAASEDDGPSDEEESQPPKTEAQLVFEKKSAVLLALAGATPATLEPLIKEHAPEIDELLLKILWRRVEAATAYDEVRASPIKHRQISSMYRQSRICMRCAHKDAVSVTVLDEATSSPHLALDPLLVDSARTLPVSWRATHAHLNQILMSYLMAGTRVQGEDVVTGLERLFSRLRTELERRASTPALRLLDDLLVILDSDAADTEEARLNIAAERMERAFDSGSGGGVDIFGVAESLGEGPAVAFDDSPCEAVSVREFVSEVGSLLDGSDKRAERARIDVENKAVRLPMVQR